MFVGGRSVVVGSFVGRRDEAAAVEKALHAPARVLILVGGAGLGKSRLLDEAARAVRADVRVLTGRCLPLSVDLPLLPIVDALRELLAVDEGRLFDTVLSRCPTFVRGEVARLLPELGDAPTGDPQRQRQFEAVRQLLVAARSSAVVIDDLHWCDAASLDLLEYLVVRPDAPAVTLAVRPLHDTSERIQHWLARIMRLPGVQRLDLRPLAPDDVVQLLDALGWTGTPDASASIAERSGGIPYYVELLAATEVDGPLPQGMQTLLQERLAGLSLPATDLLRVLSVAGRPVTDEEMQAVCGERAGDALRELAARGLIETTRTPGGSARRAPVHALLAEAVRGELIAGELRALHGRVAEAFAEQSEVSADDVARHLARAGDAAAEVAWRIRAAEQARRRASPREAYGHLARVLAIDPAAGVGVHLDAYTLARHAGETTAAAELAETMINRFEATATDPVRMQLWHAVGHHRVLRDRAGLEALARAVEIGRALPPTPQYGYLLYDFERHLRGHGQDDRARIVAAELVEVASGCDDPDLTMLADVESAWHDLLAGDDDVAMAAIARMESGSTQAIGQGLNAAAMITSSLVWTGRLPETVEYGRRVVREREEAGLSAASVTGAVRADVVAALLEQGRVDEAEAALGAAEAGLPAPDAAATAEIRSVLDVARGRIDEGLRYWDQMPVLLPYPVYLVEASPQLLIVLIEAGRPAEAARRGLEALQLILTCDQSRFAGAVIALVRRALADLVDAGQSPDDARAQSERLDAAVAAAPIDPWARPNFPSTSAAARLLDDAERSRVDGRSDPRRWQLAAQAWRGAGRPWRSGYCGWRGAQAALTTRGSRPDSVAALRQAFAEADGHVPLRAAITELGRVARVELAEPLVATARPAGLFTERESAVLRLLADGLTNAEIGRELYISPKTASVHVTHILRKLGARSRVDAATKAQRAGLLS